MVETRICKKCGIPFTPTRATQCYCGSRARKTGCAFLTYVAHNKNNTTAKKKWYENNKGYSKVWKAKQSEQWHIDARIKALAHYRRNKDKLNKQHVENVRLKKIAYMALLGSKCQLCGYDRCLAVLDFHHIEKSDKGQSEREWKKNDFQQKITGGKIMLLCANCHREVHWGIDSKLGSSGAIAKEVTVKR